jgi:hypothetical protein
VPLLTILDRPSIVARRNCASPESVMRMALYLISYDIKKYDKKEYPALYAKLEEINAETILFSEWVVVDEVGKANFIYDEIAPCIKENDRLLVQELTKDAQWDKLLMSNERFQQFLQHARG